MSKADRAQLRAIQPAIEDRQRRLRIVALLLGAAVCFLLWVAVFSGSGPKWLPLTLLVALGVAASHRETFYEDETAISGSIVVVAASVVLFRSEMLGPIICAAAVGLHWSHLRNRLWAKTAINVGATAIPAAAAAALFGALVPDRYSWWEISAVLAVAVLAYWALNNIVIAFVLAMAERRRFAFAAIQLIRSETEMLVFAFAGGLCGFLMLEVDTWVGVLALALVLVAVDVLVISKPRPATVRMQHPGLAAAVGRMTTVAVSAGAAFGFTELVGPIGAAPLGAVVGGVLTFATILGVYRRRMSAWEPQIALGVVWADAPEMIAAAVAGTVAASVGWVAGVVVAIVAVAVAFAATRWRQRRRDDDDEKDALALALVQLALLDRPEHATPAS